MLDLEIDFSELLKRASRKELDSTINGPIPAKVESFSSSRQTVDAKPTVKKWVSGEVVEPVVERDVPCLFLKTSTMTMTWEYSSGDEVLLIPCDRDISGWIASQSSDPQSKRRYATADYVALPPIMRHGALSSSDFISGLKIQTSALEVESSGSGSITATSGLDLDGTTATTIKGVAINLGAAATEFLLKGTTVLSAFTSFFSGWNTALGSLIDDGGDPSAVVTYAGTMQTLISTITGTMASWLSAKSSTE